MKRKYAVYIDYKAATSKSTGIHELDGETLIEAMCEAERYFTDDVYLMAILEKSGKAEKSKKARITPFTERLICRGCNNWHLVDNRHGEQKPVTWDRYTADAGNHTMTIWEIHEAH